MTAAGSGPPLVPRREPEVVVVGAGAFGSVLAWALGRGQRRVRTLVLESGPMDRTEHVQNFPLAQETVPPPRLLEAGTAGPAVRGSRWGVPWRSSSPYQGLAYGCGGRSLFWGGFSVWPELGHKGIREHWPATVRQELEDRYLPEAAGVLGLSQAVPHFNGGLSSRLRDRLSRALTAGDMPGVRQPGAPAPISPAPYGSCGAPPPLNLPLAIDAVAGEASGDAPGEGDGTPRLVRFSSAPLLAERLREDADGLEVLTGCHVTGLSGDGQRVTAVETDRGVLQVPRHARVVLAVGAIENARLVLGAKGLRPPQHTRTPLTTHLRSNVTVRVPFPYGPRGTPHAWGAAALQLRGSLPGPAEDSPRLHHQITAYGAGDLTDEAVRRLCTDIPRADVESLEPALRTPPRHLVVTVASVAEMARDGDGEVRLLDERDEFGARRAHVRITPGATDARTWDRMDRTADAVLRVLTGGGPCEVLRNGEFVAPEGAGGSGHGAMPPPGERREPPGCGHHEMGTLPMGDRPDSSYTDPDGRSHSADNLYIAGPAAFPALDSAGPMLPGTALTLRLADHLRHRSGPVPARGVPHAAVQHTPKPADRPGAAAAAAWTEREPPGGH